jgi:hypothetical protein
VSGTVVVVVVVVVGGTVVVVVVVVVVVGGTVVVVVVVVVMVVVVIVAIETHCSRRPDFWQRSTPALVVLTRPSLVHDRPGPGAANTVETGSMSRVSATVATAPRNNLTFSIYSPFPKCSQT